MVTHKGDQTMMSDPAGPRWPPTCRNCSRPDASIVSGLPLLNTGSTLGRDAMARRAGMTISVTEPRPYRLSGPAQVALQMTNAPLRQR
jgi:hypothetical protein